jgi:hypothetical protein
LQRRLEWSRECRQSRVERDAGFCREYDVGHRRIDRRSIEWSGFGRRSIHWHNNRRRLAERYDVYGRDVRRRTLGRRALRERAVQWIDGVRDGQYA